jgi:hypothetical protein
MDTKEYNAKYYAENKAKILQHVSEKIPCEFCTRQVTRQHMKKHQRTSVCKKQRENEVIKLKQEIVKLQKAQNQEEKKP